MVEPPFSSFRRQCNNSMHFGSFVVLFFLGTCPGGGGKEKGGEEKIKVQKIGSLSRTRGLMYLEFGA